MVLIFVPSPHRDTPTLIGSMYTYSCMYVMFSPPTYRISQFYYCGTQPICEKHEILHQAKISHYTVAPTR